MAKAYFAFMIVGTVQSDGDAIVTLRLYGPNGASLQLRAVVDTGFNDSLTITRATISSLKLPIRSETRYTPADGTESTTRLVAVELDWLDGRRRV